MKATAIPKTVDAYIKAAPAASRPHLKQLRAIIRKAAPEAEEVISYRMPLYKLNGMLVAFAGYERHVGFYALSRADLSHAKELGYTVGKGSIQFPLDKKLPVKLITQMVKEKVATNSEVQRAPRHTGPRTA